MTTTHTAARGAQINPDAEHRAFESWAAHYFNFSKFVREGCGYQSEPVHVAWLAWNAAHARALQHAGSGEPAVAHPAESAAAGQGDPEHMIMIVFGGNRMGRTHLANLERNSARYCFLRRVMAFEKPPGRPVTMTLSAPLPSPDHDVHKDWYGDRFEASVDRTVDRAIAAYHGGGRDRAGL